MMFYMTTQNAYGQRFLFRCWPTDRGYISQFVRSLSEHEEPRGALVMPS